jgi:hypothetical protein
MLLNTWILQLREAHPHEQQLVNWLKGTFGIPPQEKQPKDIREMRRIIDKAGWDCALIRSAQTAARVQGFSGEDEYVLLAYYALLELHRVSEANTRWLMTEYFPTIVVDRKSP